jgi:sugar lactone lactonase YvrE
MPPPPPFPISCGAAPESSPRWQPWELGIRNNAHVARMATTPGAARMAALPEISKEPIMPHLTRVLSLLCLVALLAGVLPAGAQGLYHNQRLFIVPAPGPVQVDGDLKDWDLSGEILTYVTEASMTYQSAKTAMMYDREALYISSRVADPTPMLNKADPAVNPDFGWDGDAFQLRLCLDPGLGYPLKIGNYDRSPSDMLVHMTLWYYTDKKQPVLHLKYGMNYHDSYGYHKGIVPAEKYLGAYVPGADGKGFTFEYRIPWSTLGTPRPLAGGDMTAAAIQIQWSDATGLHSYGGGWAVDLMAHAGFTYQSTHAWGKALFAEKGNLPKELTQDGVPPVRKLPLKFDFSLQKEQITSVTLINAKGDRVRHIVAAQSRPAGPVTESWDGLDDRGKVLPAGDYTWKGAYHDPFTLKHILSVSNSGTPSYNTPDGKGAWGGDWGEPADAAFAGERGALLWDGSEAGMGLIGVDLKGRKQWGYRIGGSHLATDGEWVFVFLNLEKQIRVYGLADGKQINFQRGELWAEPNSLIDGEAKKGPDGKPLPVEKVKGTRCDGMAWQNGKLYVAKTADNEIAVYDAKKGTLTGKLSIPAPSAVTAAGPGLLLVVSEGRLKRVAVADGTMVEFAKEHLDAPQDIAVGADGAVYVSNAGALHNVSLFDKDGKFLKSIGKAGGRAMTGAVQTEGNVSLARAGKWDGEAMLSPRGLAVDSKGRLWVMEHDFSPKRVSVWDPATGKLVDEKFGPAFVSTPICMDPTDPTRVYCQNVEWEIDLAKGTSRPAAIMFEARPDTPYFWPHMVNNIVFTAKNGKQYMHHKSYQGSAVAGQYLWVRRGDRFAAVAGIIPPSAALTWRTAAAKTPWLLWEDLSGDGVIGQDECRPTTMIAQNSHSIVDANLNMYATGMYNDLYWQRISPKKIQPNGVPLYDDASIVRFNYGEKHGGNYTYEFTVNPADGSVLMYAGTDIKLLDKTELWPITTWTKDGQLQWRYRKGCRWHDMYEFPIPKAGELYGCTRNLGITDGITGYSCYFGQCQLLTTDGVTLGTIMKDGRSGETGADQIQCEWFTGQLVKTKDKRWYLMGGDQDGRVLEVLGLNSVQRFAGKLTITPAQVKAAEEALAEWSTQKAKSQSLVLSRIVAKPAWVDIRGVTVEVDAKRSFTAKAAYDKENLYLRYEVRSPNELVNSALEIQQPFKGGNCLDLQLATDPAANPKRTTPAPGDLRLLITRRAGKAMAVVYRPKVAGFAGDPIVFTSPTGKESFDRIEVWDDVKLDYEKTAEGFIAVAALPLAKLGLAPKSGTLQRMDVGYIFGNETGNITATRAYWSNQSFSSKVTQDIPNEARLEPGQWGSATVE